MKLGEVKPKVGRENVKLEDILPIIKLPANKWVTLRLLPLDVLPVGRHWVNIIAGKDKREVKIPKICVSFDPNTEGDKKGVKCPYCELSGNREVFYLANVISRSEQEQEPAKKPKLTKDEADTGFKDPASNSWTPVGVLRLTSTLAKKVQGLRELNKHKNKKTGKIATFDVSDARFGVDINVKHDPNAKGAEQYQVNLGDKSPLSEEEQAYLVHELTESIIEQLGRETPEEAKRERAKMQIVGEDELPGEDDEDDYTVGKGKKPNKKKVVDDDEDDEDDDEDDDEPVSKSKKKPASSKRKVVDDEDDEDEDDEDDEDEDDEDEPVRKSKKKPASKRKVIDDDDDEDEDDDEDDEDDEDEPVRKSSKKPAPKKPASKRKVIDDDEDEDDDEDDDDEDDDEDDEDEPVSKSKKKPASKKPASKRKVIDDDDDDDEDEEDEPVRKSSKKPTSKKPTTKKASKKVVDDDDDDDVPF